MSDEKVTLSRPVEPLTVTVIGTGDGSKLASGTEAVTPGDHQPNLITNVVGPTVAILVRFANMYLTTFVGFLGAAQTKQGAELLHASDFSSMVITCASLALAGPVVDFFKNLVTIFGRLERKYPLLTGSI